MSNQEFNFGDVVRDVQHMNEDGYVIDINPQRELPYLVKFKSDPKPKLFRENELVRTDRNGFSLETFGRMALVKSNAIDSNQMGHDFQGVTVEILQDINGQHYMLDRKRAKYKALPSNSNDDWVALK